MPTLGFELKTIARLSVPVALSQLGSPRSPRVFNGIRVTAILPGLVDTQMPMNRLTPPTRETMDNALQPEDVALACTFLARRPSHAYIPDLIMMPPQLQVVGQAMA